MDQEIDCVAGRSANADTGSAWTNGFGNEHPSGNSPTRTTAVFDKTMPNQCKVLAFAPLASDAMLAVVQQRRHQDDGERTAARPDRYRQPLRNLRFQKSGASGTWTNVAGVVAETATSSPPTATIDQNDWTLVPVNQSSIYAFRAKAGNAGVEGASYNAAGNSWSSLSGALAPPAFVGGQAFKAAGGLFGATDGTNVWLFLINTDAANSILFTKFTGAAWTPWALVPGTNSGTQTRKFITGQPDADRAGQIGLAWTQGSGTFDVFSMAFEHDRRRRFLAGHRHDDRALQRFDRLGDDGRGQRDGLVDGRPHRRDPVPARRRRARRRGHVGAVRNHVELERRSQRYALPDRGRPGLAPTRPDSAR